MLAAELKDRISMEEVLEELGFEVKEWGWRSRTWSPILCPFCEDTNGSAGITTQAFNCFQCGTKGDIFDIIVKVRGYDFLQACDWLRETFLSD